VELRALLRRRGPILLGSGVLASLGTFLALWASLTLLGVSGVGWFAALSAFSLVRVAGAVTPIPGGLGITELGLLSLLASSSTDRAGVVGAIVLFRAVTWLLPMLVGSAGFLAWRRFGAQRAPRRVVTVTEPTVRTAERYERVAGRLLG
jgi:uncharacterized membrane protein YbhN (UPF0104 family)